MLNKITGVVAFAAATVALGAGGLLYAINRSLKTKPKPEVAEPHSNVVILERT